MYKRGVFFNTEYKKRWFVLKGNLLFYFKSKSALTDPTGVIFLEDALVDASQRDSLSGVFHEFAVRFPGNQEMRSYHLATKSKDATQEWVQAIRNAGFAQVKEKLDALQMRLFQAEFSFGIEEAEADDGAGTAPVAQSPVPPVLESGRHASQASISLDDGDSSEDDEHYRHFIGSTIPSSPPIDEEPSPNEVFTETEKKEVLASSAISFRSMLDSTSEELLQGSDSTKDAVSSSWVCVPEPPIRKPSLANPVASSSKVPVRDQRPTGPAPVPPARHPSRILKGNPNEMVGTGTQPS